MFLILLLAIFLNVITTEAASGDVRLARGNSRYGFVEIQIGDEWKPVCPGDNFKDNSAEISNAVCQQLGFKSGMYHGGMPPYSGYDSWWYTEFQHELFSTPLVPKLDAYRMQKWLKVSGTGQYESCKRTTMAVVCRGSVYLQVGEDRDITQSTIRGFGYVVVDDTTKTVVNEDGLNDKAVNVICKELGYNAGTKVSDSTTVGFHTSLTVQQKLYNCDGSEASLTDCPTTDKTDSNQKPAIISCSGNNTVPNYTARVASNQIVEIMNQNTWGVICADGFTDNDATVVCKSLGFNGGMKVTAELREIYPIWIKQLNCGGSETKPGDCNVSSWTTSDSKCQSVAAVRCDTGTSIRLTNGGGEYFGNHFFERTSSSQTGLIAVERIPGSQVCKTLGFTSGNMYDIPVPSLLPEVTSYWTSASGVNYIDNVYDDSYWQYKTDGLANGIKMAVCHNMVYLKGNGYAGLVNYDGGSGNRGLINKATLSSEETNLICKHLGYTNGGTQVPALNYQPADAVSQNDIYDVQCAAGATDISDCTFTRLPSKTNIEIAAVKCSLVKPLPMADNDVFLGEAFVVNVVKQGVPGAICASDSWDDKAALVVCRQMGFDVAVLGSESIDNSYGTNYPPVWFKSISCQGSEASISSCTLQPLVTGDTLCRKVAAVVCYSQAKKAKLELVDGTSRFGRVKITREGKEGYLCLNKLGEEEAATICREVGYKDGNEWPMEPVGRTGTAWWYVSTNCDDETKIIEGCKGQKWKYVTDPGHECSWKTSSVYCYSNVRLSTAPYLSYGPIRISETKARFSSDSFSKTEADIGCKEMGYSQGGDVITSAVFDKRKEPIIIQCTGNEKSLINCPVAGKSDDKTKFASVSCTTDEIVPVATSFKLNDDYIVLISRSGVWGGLCADKWTQKDAAVVCGQLMGGGGQAFAKGRVKVEYATFKEPWNCVGGEQNLINCPVDASIVDKSCDTYAAVYCDNQLVTALDTPEYPFPPGQTLTTPSPPTSSTAGNTVNTSATAATADNASSTTGDGSGNEGYSIVPSTSILVLCIACICKVHWLIM